jgi:hypothetical protein
LEKTIVESRKGRLGKAVAEDQGGQTDRTTARERLNRLSCRKVPQGNGMKKDDTERQRPRRQREIEAEK